MAGNLNYVHKPNHTKVVTSFYNKFKQIIMKTKFVLLLAFAATLGSCTTMYKSGQTPDDVYFSPVRTYDENSKEDQRESVRSNNDNDERNIRLGINDRRYRYNYDNDYRYNNYNYNAFNYGFNQGYYYNPYFWPVPIFNPIFVTPAQPKNATPRTGNLGGYNNNNNSNTNIYTNPKTGTKIVKPNSNGSAVGNAIRKILAPVDNSNPYNNSNNNNNNNNNSSSNNNTRTYTPATNSNNNSSSSGSSSSTPSSSGSGGVSRPPRSGGNN